MAWWLITAFVGLVAYMVGWCMGEQNGYDRANDEWLSKPKPRDWKKPEGP